MKKKLPENKPHKPEREIFTIKIGGQAGQGIKSAGLLFAKTAARSGYQTYDHTEYPSLIGADIM